MILEAEKSKLKDLVDAGSGGSTGSASMWVSYCCLFQTGAQVRAGQG